MERAGASGIRGRFRPWYGITGNRPRRAVISGRDGQPLTSRSGEMADATDSKSVARKGVWVQVPPPVLLLQRKRRLLSGRRTRNQGIIQTRRFYRETDALRCYAVSR